MTVKPPTKPFEFDPAKECHLTTSNTNKLRDTMRFECNAMLSNNEMRIHIQQPRDGATNKPSNHEAAAAAAAPPAPCE